MCEAAYHERVRPLVRQFGPAKVWAVGLATLRYPPTWIETGSELAILRAALT